MTIPYFRPSIGEEERAAVDAILRSGWLTTGTTAGEFEASFAEYLGVTHAVAVNSCTAALHLALEAAGVEQDDLVLVPTMTFAATAEVVRYLGARPVLVDCDPRSLCVDPDAMEEAAAHWSLRGRLKAMIPVHYGGQMADMFRLNDIARRYDLQVVEDAAHAMPAFLRREPKQPWQPVGSTSQATCFSFYANKCITTGEGGMVTTNDASTAERVRMMSLHGLSRSAWNRFETPGNWYYEILEAGFKYNLTDMAAAIGVTQLAKSDAFWRRRREIAALYTELLSRHADFVETPPELPNRLSSWHLYPIQLRTSELTIDRGRFIDELKSRGITTSVHWMPLHLHPYYRQRYGYRAEDLPTANAVWPRLISLPIFPAMTDAEVFYVCESIGAIAQQNARRNHSVEAVA